jgi:hypothetical protein
MSSGPSYGGANVDSERFDRLVRSFGQPRSRRQTVRGLAAAIAVGTLALGEREARADECKRNGKPCKKNGQCCSHNCVGASGKSTAKSDGTCQPYQSTCAGGEDWCRDFTACDEVCGCFPTLSGGTICGFRSEFISCESDQDCVDHPDFGEDSVCSPASGCFFQKACAIPCNRASGTARLPLGTEGAPSPSR